MTTNYPPQGEPDYSSAPQYPAVPQPGYETPQGYGAPPGYGQAAYGAPTPYGQPQGYGPAPTYGVPGYPAQHGYVAPTSSATAIVGAVLAFLGGLASVISLFSLGLVIQALDGKDVPGWISALLYIELVGALVRLVVLVAGGVLLLKRRVLGRTLVLVGCGVAIATSLLDVAIYASASSADLSLGVGALFGTVLGLIFPVATVVLLLLPITTRWLKSA